MTFQAVKAIVNQERRVIFWLLLGSAVITALLGLINRHSPSSTRQIDHVIWVLFGLLLGVGIRARDFRTGIHTWLDALPVRPAAIVAVRFIWRLLVVAAGGFILFWLHTLLRSGLTGFAWEWQHRNALPSIYTGVAAFSLCALFAVIVRKELPAMGLGLLSLILVSAVYEKLLGLYRLYAASHLLIVILAAACFGGCLWATWKAGKSRSQRLKRALLPLAAGIVLAAGFGSIWSRYLLLMSLHNADAYFMIHPVPAREGGLIVGRQQYMGEYFFTDPWLVTTDGNTKLPITIATQCITISDIIPSPDGVLFATAKGIFTVQEGRIIPVEYPFVSGLWSADSRFFAYVSRNSKRLAIIPVGTRGKEIAWELDKRTGFNIRFILAGWLDANTLVVGQELITDQRTEQARLWTLSTGGEKTLLWQGAPWEQPSWLSPLPGCLVVYPARRSVVMLRQSGQENNAVVEELFVETRRMTRHGTIGIAHGYCPLATENHSLLGWFEEHTSGPLEFHLMDLQTGSRKSYAFVAQDFDPVLWKIHFNVPRISPNGQYLAAAKGRDTLALLDLTSGRVSKFTVPVLLWTWTRKNNLFICNWTRISYLQVKTKNMHTILQTNDRRRKQ